MAAPMSKPPTRQIIQIAAAYAPGDPENADRLFALCDDGSVWFHMKPIPGRSSTREERWVRLLDIPQD